MSGNAPVRGVSGLMLRVALFCLFVAVLLFGHAAAAEEGAGEPLPRSGQIVGGQVADDGEWPWQVALLDAGGDSYNGQFCGGSLIAPGWVLTAAHCVVDYGQVLDPADVQILAGIHNLIMPDAGHQRIDIRQIIVHPNYNDDGSYDEDLALLELATEAVLGPTTGGQMVGVVPLVAADVGDLTGQIADITGWGRTGTGYPVDLREARVPVVSNDDCNDENSYDGAITDNMLCAGFTEGGVDTCQGDSGGPLVVGGPDNFRLAGITSWGTGCALPDKYGVYTRVSRYVEWIEEYVDPVPAPVITSVTPTSGEIGATVTINGTNLSGATQVAFNAVAAAEFTVVSDTELTAVVPEGATTGRVSVTTPGGTSASPSRFTVLGVPITYQAYLPIHTHWPTMLVGRVGNGDFEQGLAVWERSSLTGLALIYEADDLPIAPHGGEWAARLGTENGEVSTISQYVAVPMDRTYLSYYHAIESSDLCDYDFARVRIDNTVVYEISLCSSTITNGWLATGVDLSDYAGRVVELTFEVDNDNSYRSGYLLDDITFAQSPPPPALPLRNGGFEQGADIGWSQSSSKGWSLIRSRDDLPVIPHGGAWAAWLGGDDDETSRLWQTVTIVPDSPVLTYYDMVISMDVCGHDLARIWFGSSVVREFSLCDSNDWLSWRHWSIDLSAYAGQTGMLRFELVTNGSVNSSWFIDTISFGPRGRDNASSPADAVSAEAVPLPTISKPALRK